MLPDKTYTSAPSSLGEELMITGNISSKGDLHLRGQLQGDVHCHKLLVGEAAQIEGNVVAEEVVIQGRVVGAVRAAGVVLQAQAMLRANSPATLSP